MNQNFSGKQARTGFTLIELLIVVAIIAILAAIAVPNFLEAQTRAKVSRVKADMRSLATGVATYQVDYNKVFPSFRLDASQTREWIWGYMTTPIAYMTSVPQDPFNNVDENPANRVIVFWGPDYIQGDTLVKHRDGTQTTVPDVTNRAATFFEPYPQYSDGSDLLKRDFWVMFSLGPDGGYNILGPDRQDQGQYPSPMTPYDPTNGTVSSGDIVRFQGGQVE